MGFNMAKDNSWRRSGLIRYADLIWMPLRVLRGNKGDYYRWDGWSRPIEGLSGQKILELI
jgi:hypothetical protein